LISRRSQLAVCAALVAGVVVSAYAIEYNEWRLNPRVDGDFLYVTAPNFSFLNGKSLERLKDGVSVAFIAQLTVSTTPNYVVPDARSVARFAVSYDIFEERFSVTRITDYPGQKLSVSHRTGPAAEAWCFDQLTLNRSDLPADRPFYIQLDMRVEDPRDTAGMIGEGGISLGRMIQLFSRPVRDKQAHWLLNSGQIRLDDVLRKGPRG
jgi:hypothetical protein